MGGSISGRLRHCSESALPIVGYVGCVDEQHRIVFVAGHEPLGLRAPREGGPAANWRTWKVIDTAAWRPTMATFGHRGVPVRSRRDLTIFELVAHPRRYSWPRLRKNGFLNHSLLCQRPRQSKTPWSASCRRAIWWKSSLFTMASACCALNFPVDDSGLANQGLVDAMERPAFHGPRAIIVEVR